MTSTGNDSADRSPDGSAGPAWLARVRVGDSVLALDAESVEGVEAGPVVCLPLPGMPPHILGAATARGMPVAVLDAAAALGLAGATAAPGGPLLVLRVEGQRVGMRIDRVLGLMRAGEVESTPVRVTNSASRPRFTHLLQPRRAVAAPDHASHAELAGPWPLIDTATLARVPALPWTAARAEARATTRVRRGTLHVVLTVAGATCAVSAARVERVVRADRVEPLAMAHPTLRGFLALEHAQGTERVAVMDPSHALARPLAGGSHVLVLRRGDGPAVGVLVDAIVAVHAIDEASLTPVADVEDPLARLSCGCTTPDELTAVTREAVHVLDADRVIAALDAPDTHHLFAVERTGTARAVVDADARAASWMLVVRAGGGLLAAPLSDVRAVERLEPTDSSGGDDRALPAFVTRRGHRLPVVDLSAALRRGADDGRRERPLLVVERPDGAVALAVDALVGLHRVATRAIPRALQGMLLPGVAIDHTVAVAMDGRVHAVAVVSLAQVAAFSVPAAA